MEGEAKKKKISISTIVITTVAIIIILVLVFLFYYYAGKAGPTYNPEQVVYTNKNVPVKKVEPPVVVPAVETTNVITFKVPDVLPTLTKQGKCTGSSVAQPFREDAFRCIIGKLVYDPCFTVTQKGFVYCQVGIDESTGFLMKLTTVLPKPSLPTEKLTNWAWFVKLKDGTTCSPFTGAKLTVQDKTANYGCKSNVKDEQIVLMGDLTVGTVWTAEKAIIVKDGTNLIVKSSERVNIETVWQ